MTSQSVLENHNMVVHRPNKDKDKDKGFRFQEIEIMKDHET